MHPTSSIVRRTRRILKEPNHQVFFARFAVGGLHLNEILPISALADPVAITARSGT